MTQATHPARNHVGSCHCGAVKFEARVDASSASACNCTVCAKLGSLNTLVVGPRDEAELPLSCYGFDSAKLTAIDLFSHSQVVQLMGMTS